MQATICTTNNFSLLYTVFLGVVLSTIGHAKQYYDKILISTFFSYFRIYGSLTMNCIAKAGFGIEVDALENPNSPFVENAKSFVSFSFSNPVVVISSEYCFKVMFW